MTASYKLACPNCGLAELVSREQIVTLRSTLRDWQIHGNLKFPDVVWSDYAAVLDDEMRLHCCPACSFRQFVPPHAGTSSFYAAITQGEGGYYTADRWEFRKAIAAIGKFGAKSVLDAGCGTGDFLRQLKAAGPYNAYGYDFNPGAASILAAAGLESLADLDHPVMKDGFDAITCLQVLEHLEDPWSFGAKLRCHLRTGGMLILTTPDADGPIRHFTTSHTDLPPHHVSRWNADAIRAFGAQFGFKVRRILREPLPNYVWRYYLPAMIRNSAIPEPVKVRLLAANRVERFLGLLEKVGVRELPPLGGHTLYAEFEG